MQSDKPDGAGADGSVVEVSFAPGEVLFHENEHSFHFFIIQEGEVEVFKRSPDGREVLLATVGESKACGEFAMIDRLPRSATARAKTPVRAARISDEAYQKLLADLPEWALCVMSTLVERLRQTNELLRHSVSVSPTLKQTLDSIEYDTNEESNPFLRRPEDDEPL